MTVIDVPALDLAPTVPSRIVYGTVLIPTEDRGPQGEWIEAAIPGEIKLPGEHTTITGRSQRVAVNPDGSFQMRLPTIAEGIEPEDWALSMRLSWRRFAFPMRVPVGDEPIWIEDCLFPELLPDEDPSRYFLAGAQIRSVTTVGPDQPARVRTAVEAGVLSMDFELPRGAQGLPGATAIEGDEAVAGYIGTPGESATKAVLDENYAARELTASASRTAIEYWVSPTGDDSGSGSLAAPFRTVAKAMSMVPDMVRADHIYTITLEPGEWDEMITPEHRVVYGQLIVQGSTDDPRAHRVTGVRAETILGHLTVRNLHGTSIFGSVFRFYRCAPLVEVENVVADSETPFDDNSEGVIGLLADTGSNVLVRNSEFNGRRYGMRCNYLSRIFSRNNTGTGNQYGLGARWGGILSTSGTQPGGTTSLTTDSGGIIGFEHGGKIGTPSEVGLIESYGQGDSAPLEKRYRLTSNVTFINGDVTGEQRFRLRFRAPQDGYLFVRVTYGAQTSASSSQSIQKHFYGHVRSQDFLNPGSTLITSQSMSDSTMTMQHTGADRIFDVLIAPLAALSGRWGIDVQVSMLRGYEAPVLQNVTVV